MSVGAVNKQTGDRIPTAGMPAIDDALDLTSVNPVQNAVITAALANKQDKTDNSLQTTDKTVVGAINEHEGDIDSLKSGLTNVNVALSVPENSGKNVLPLTLDNLKSLNTSGTWSGNAYTRYDITYTVSVDSDGRVTKINANGTSTNDGGFQLAYGTYQSGNYIMNGCPSGGSLSTYYIQSSGESGAVDTGSGVNVTSYNNVYIYVKAGTEINKDFYPMIRPATITDPTFAPYIPSVESRIEAVESGLDDVSSKVVGTITYSSKAQVSSNDPTRLIKNGRVVQLWLNAVTIDSMTQYVDSVAVLPEGFRPDSVIYASCYIESQNSILRIGTGGGLLVTENIESGKHITGLICFIV